MVALFGARGSGKSTAAKAFLAKHGGSAIVWDTMDEYDAHARTVGSLVELLTAAGAARAAGAPFMLRYVPRGTDAELTLRFEAFCKAAYALGELVLVVEELQRVTRPSWAPASWSDCTLRGRHRQVGIIGISQRPASVDKNFFSNATVVRSGRLNFADDVSCMANVLQVPAARIGALLPFHYIERNMLTGEVTEGELAPASAPPPGAAPRRKKNPRRARRA